MSRWNKKKKKWIDRHARELNKRGNHKSTFGGNITQGTTTRRVYSKDMHVLAWGDIHQDELMENWELAKQDLPLKKIAPLM